MPKSAVEKKDEQLQKAEEEKRKEEKKKQAEYRKATKQFGKTFPNVYKKWKSKSKSKYANWDEIWNERDSIFQVILQEIYKLQPPDPEPQPDYDDPATTHGRDQQSATIPRSGGQASRPVGPRYTVQVKDEMDRLRKEAELYKKTRQQTETENRPEKMVDPFKQEKDKLESSLRDAKDEISRLRETVKAMTQRATEDLARHNQEIEKLKTLLKEAQSEEKTKKMEPHKTTDTLVQRGKEEITARYEQEIDALRKKLKDAELLNEKIYTLQNERESLTLQVEKLTSEKKEALTRLSEVAGRKLLDNNPNIADLSTEIRPTKIGENFMQVYDNEWTDAFEELERDNDDKQSIQILLSILKDTFEYTKVKAKNFETRIISIFSAHTEDQKDDKTTPNISKEEMGLIRQLKKVSATRTKITIQDEYVKERKWIKGENSKIFARKCIEMCWYMAIQTPPMTLMFDVTHMNPFDEKYFKKYMTSGDRFDFLVWPCTLLHKDGAIVAKGIAEATTMKATHVNSATGANNTEPKDQKLDTIVTKGTTGVPTTKAINGSNGDSCTAPGQSQKTGSTLAKSTAGATTTSNTTNPENSVPSNSNSRQDTQNQTPGLTVSSGDKGVSRAETTKADHPTTTANVTNDTRPEKHNQKREEGAPSREKSKEKEMTEESNRRGENKYDGSEESKYSQTTKEINSFSISVQKIPGNQNPKGQHISTISVSHL